jgi:hypothetical protein
MFYSPSQVIFGLEVVGDVNETFNAASQVAASQVAGSTSFIGGGTNITNINVGSAALSDLIYLNTSIPKIADIITPNTATFTGAVILEPANASELPPTTKDNFTYYVNGQTIPPTLVVSISGAGGNVTVIFDTNAIGYTLEADDEVLVIGKFA